MADWVIPALGISIPILIPAWLYMNKAEARRVESKLDSRIDVHVAEDKVIHDNVSSSLIRIEAKLDRLIEKDHEPHRRDH